MPSAGYYLSPEDAAKEAKCLINEGFSGYKYRAGLGIEEDKRTLEAIREAVGPEPRIIVDSHAWWSRKEFSYSKSKIQSLIEFMSDYDIYWVEEPVPPDDYRSYRDLHDSTGVSLAGGENENTPGSLVNMGELADVSFLQGDVKQHGGFSGCKQVVNYCEKNSTTYVPHNYGTELGAIANAHLAAAAPEIDFLEYPIYARDNTQIGMYPFPLATDILTTGLDVENGTLHVPSEPGLGVEVDLGVIEEYAYVDGPWSENVSRDTIS